MQPHSVDLMELAELIHTTIQEKSQRYPVNLEQPLDFYTHDCDQTCYFSSLLYILLNINPSYYLRKQKIKCDKNFITIIK